MSDHTTEFWKMMGEEWAANQGKLPEEDRMGVPCCMAEDEDDGYICTRDKHSSGQHVAHNHLGKVVWRWSAAPGFRAPVTGGEHEG